jgi:hypothetical protein
MNTHQRVSPRVAIINKTICDSFTSSCQIEAMQTIIKSAMNAGQTRARIQTLRYGYHFTYSRNHPQEEEGGGGGEEEENATFPLYDAWTMQLVSISLRVALSSASLDLLHWVRSQGMQTLLTTMSLGATGDKPADFIYVMAIFVPITNEIDRFSEQDALVAWNTMYMLKCLDETRIRYWALRCHNAVCMGQMHVAICTLYWQSDFANAGGGCDSSLIVRTPRHHITMQPYKAEWHLDARLSVLTNWVNNIGYKWTLCAPTANAPAWAYFVVLLDPLSEYHALK